MPLPLVHRSWCIYSQRFYVVPLLVYRKSGFISYISVCQTKILKICIFKESYHGVCAGELGARTGRNALGACTQPPSPGKSVQGLQGGAAGNSLPCRGPTSHALRDGKDLGCSVGIPKHKSKKSDFP